ncbi:hypothetical protein GCM10010156_34650 [Planobispora rosea]|uniref:Uncharacterized protein n=1 Tax=Planobispora rosea TaxID=35762 RepID=A0A8J3S5D5_PLARO|nr:hypothetical protein [Planobispora rosea]GGS72824.1 hypothetical protein GCM10010156_34650 [Planobispora rosea]GIH85329.1 hypothetical protein Pro02_37370 [Planobispora rosea]
MSGKRISIDDLLANQEQPQGIRATIEAVADQPGKVKVTPYLPGGGCQCAVSVVLPKEAIESLTTTDEDHWCCGKRLSVVQVNFADPTLADVVRQFTDPSRQRATGSLPGPDSREWALRAVPVADDYAPRVYLDTRTAATGMYIDYATGAPIDVRGSSPGGVSSSCASKRATCLVRCRDPHDLQCLCNCEKAYFECQHPGEHYWIDCAHVHPHR